MSNNSNNSNSSKNGIRYNNQPPTILSKQHDKKGDSFTISLAAATDLPQIVDIYNQSILTKQSTADLETITVADRQQWFDEHRSRPERPLYVIKNPQGDVLAWGSFSDVKSRPAYRISSEISIYVSNQYHRRGLASLILQWMLSQASSLGIEQVLALIFAHNTSSIALFTKFGFENWGTLPKVCDMGDFLADVTIMGKSVLRSERHARYNLRS